jgi:hypothetical protein
MTESTRFAAAAKLYFLLEVSFQVPAIYLLCCMSSYLLS